MMAVMVFDAKRRGQVITQSALSEYTLALATAVTDAMHYFIGHDTPSPKNDQRYHAVTAAHITHMLRDAIEDAESGYFNLPQEYLKERGITSTEVNSQAYREWVCASVQLARRYFQSGREYLIEVKNLRCRLAGFAYAARFEWMLGAIERENYCLRSEYPERKSLRTSLWMAWTTIWSFVASPWIRKKPCDLAAQPAWMREL
jgi:phytoene/squalene synthetase